MNRISFILCNIFCFVFSFYLYAQELPPIKNYEPKEYGGENQNWSISQSNNKNIYIANNSGLLEFNGVYWNLYPSPNATIMRSVKIVNKRIYTGCYKEFGFWEKNDFGGLNYTSLSEKLAKPLLEENFWNIIHLDKWILFQSLHRIYIYNTTDNSFKIINSKTQLPKVFKVDDNIFFQEIGEGIFEIKNGKSVLISDDTLFKTNILVNIFKVDEKILYQTQQNGFYFLNNNIVSKWRIKADSIISKISVFSSLQLNDGSLILGSISNGIYHLTKNGVLVSHINQENGLNNNTILSVFEDKENNIWLGLDNGVSVININSPITAYNDVSGKLGSIYAIAIHNDNLYLGTNQGLFYKKINSNNHFRFIDGTDGQVWCLRVFDNTLFCGHNKGTFVINNGVAHLITNIMGTLEIKQIKNNKNLLIQGYYNGLNIIEKTNNKWHLRNKIDGFNLTSRYFDFIKDGNILVNHEYRGMFNLKPNKDFTKIVNYKILKSAPKGLKSTLSKYNDSLFYISNKGIFRYNNKKNIFKKDTLLTDNFLKDDKYISGKLIEDKKTSTLWGFTKNNIIYFSQAKLNNMLTINKINISSSKRSNVNGFESVFHLKDKKYLFGSSKGYFVLNLKKIRKEAYKIKINSIKINSFNRISIPVSLYKNGKFKNIDNNVTFRFSVPQYNKFTKIKFQYKLTGQYNKWSKWIDNSEITFDNLPFGSYKFEIRAKIGEKLTTNIASYSFKILRPFALSNIALLTYLLILIIIIILTHKTYKIYYAKQRQRLIETNKKKFERVKLENEKEIILFKNNQLLQDVESKNRELAASTMSLIKRNELLVSLKKDLLKIESTEVKSAIKIIDKNLNNNNDWEFFKEAFNNVDKNFLKKIKKLHPDLTPNDLRFCAYLRLNLSSKEIAPLLNVSVRSVETKRYRLRKKMKLSHNLSLVYYILEV